MQRNKIKPKPLTYLINSGNHNLKLYDFTKILERIFKFKENGKDFKKISYLSHILIKNVGVIITMV